jgi:c(7)-type cytochrome triheme protein
MNKLRIVLAVLSLLYVSVLMADTFGTRKRAPKPEEYGNVIINNYSQKARIAPVEFNHWLHRARYTCRLCHVDLGFATEAGDTLITEEDNRDGLYCGACHDGKEAFGPEDRTRSGETVQNCGRCHSVGTDIEPEHDFRTFVKGFPRARFGNRVDWLKAEEQGLLELTDYIEGVSIPGRKFEAQEDFELDTGVNGMPDVIFSHEKHAVWNGCELCHPQIFQISRSSDPFEMQEIFDGKYCGACHGRVAFSNSDCQLCHAKDVY